MILVVTQLTKKRQFWYCSTSSGVPNCIYHMYFETIIRIYIYTYVDAFGNDYTHIHTYMDVEWNGR